MWDRDWIWMSDNPTESIQSLTRLLASAAAPKVSTPGFHKEFYLPFRSPLGLPCLGEDAQTGRVGCSQSETVRLWALALKPADTEKGSLKDEMPRSQRKKRMEGDHGTIFKGQLDIYSAGKPNTMVSSNTVLELHRPFLAFNFITIQYF